MYNGLMLDRINSQVYSYVKQINNEDDLLSIVKNEFGETGYFIAYLNYKVIIGRFDKNFITYENDNIDPIHLQKMRVFNQIKEIYLWKTESENFNIRVRIDGEGELVDIVKTKQVLWGTKAKKLDDEWSKIYEQRGIEIIIPFSNVDINDKEKRIKIETINYIGYNDIGQAGYIDSRFVDFHLGGE